MVDVIEIRPGVHLVHGSDTNWVILTEGDAVALVDTGYPGDRERLVASLAAVGRRPEDLTAILVTHAHVDHIGSAEHLSATFGVPVLMHREEVPHARREFLQQATPGLVLRNAWRPGVLPWATRVLRVGATADVRVTSPREFPETLDVPGRPVSSPHAMNAPLDRSATVAASASPSASAACSSTPASRAAFASPSSASRNELMSVLRGSGPGRRRRSGRTSRRGTCRVR